MSQIFNIVKCVECSIFQVDINKKSTNKWTCKICTTKQSLKQVFFQGGAKECRLKVQTMNLIKHEVQNAKDLNRLEQINNEEPYNQNAQIGYSNKDNDYEYEDNRTVVSPQTKKPSKWAKYLTNDDDDEY